MENYILALDASTSKMGIALFKDCDKHGYLESVSHLDIGGSNSTIDDVWDKADNIGKYLSEKYKDKNITRIIIEESLPTSGQANTAKLLNKFNALLYPSLLHNMGIKPNYISVDNARRYGLPELLGGIPNKKGKVTKTLFGAFPKEIGGLARGKWLKFLIMYLVSIRYKGIQIKLNNNLSIDVDNFDSCDAIVAGLGYMIKEGYWQDMASDSFWGTSETFKNKTDDCVAVIEKNVAYAKFCALDQIKKLSAEQKRITKRKYLDEVYQIKSYFNVEY